MTKLNIGLLNPKNPSNVGSVIRAAGCFQVDNIFYSGKRYDNAMKFNTDTKNVKSKIPLISVDGFSNIIDTSTKLICVDLVQGAIALPLFEHPDNALYLFGPEDGSIPQHLIDKADAVVYVPTIGCMNLAASVNVLLYDRMVKRKNFELGDDLIKSSRDKNNNTKV